ncbi:hypothetical protein R3W88_025275 [Solanum pinnatisectum]|uniref:Uncharacterized protein n=1 Tax=Solanum pinnatisectum TaxID=50273 RepID=A0AAV9M4D3_9SOLN|nr:hypothetical protein R3W88_025275 [Solanum pinnatisectum]
MKRIWIQGIMTGSMQLVTWNIRGMNKLHKQKELKLFVKENKVSIIAVLEHKIKENMANKIVRKTLPGWKYEANYEYSNKWRIWLIWNPQLIECVILSKSEQYIQGRIKLRSRSLTFLFVAVYGLHTIQSRKSLWDDLRVLNAGVNEPMICLGYYNTILSGDDRV